VPDATAPLGAGVNVYSIVPLPSLSLLKKFPPMTSALSPRPSGIYLFHANGVPRLTAFEMEFGHDTTGIHGWELRTKIDSYRATVETDASLRPESKRLALDILALMNFRRFVTEPTNGALFCVLLLLVGGIIMGSAESGSTPAMAGTALLAIAVIWGVALLGVAWYTAVELGEIRVRERSLVGASVNTL
jgi:hypothetical protein